MPTKPSSIDSSYIVQSLLRSMRNKDREAIILHLLELGLWVSVTADPLPPPDVSVVSALALAVCLHELRTTVQQNRSVSMTIPERDKSSVAAIIERNNEMVESVIKALEALTPVSGLLMVEG